MYGAQGAVPTIILPDYFRSRQNLMQPTKASSTIDTSTEAGATSSRAARLEKLQQIARDGGYDFIALVPGPTLFYLTGVSYHLSERPILAFIPSQGDAALIVPQLEFQKMV